MTKTRRKWWVLAIAPIAFFALTAQSCTMVGNFDAVYVEGEHIDFAPDPNFLDLLCMFSYGVDHPCWPINTVWWHETWYKKVFYNGVWQWRYNGAGWVSRGCKIWVWEAGHDPNGPCYNINGVQLYGSKY